MATTVTAVAAGDEDDYQFGPHEQPTLPGGPYTPQYHHAGRRIAYAVVALLVGIATQFGNALITVNLANIAGNMGVTVSDATWLSSVYVAVNASGNLLLVRARIQFGVPKVTNTLLIGYALTTIAQLFSPNFATALLVQATAGLCATGLTTLTLYYLIQALPPKLRPLALIIGISIPQLATPLARMVPVEMLVVDHWRGLHLIYLSTTVTVIAAISLARLPPSIRQPSFEPLDFLTFGLAFPGLLLFCGAIGAGRYLWWTDTPWLGYALVGSVVLLTAAFLIEHYRRNPLILTYWLGSVDIVRFAIITLLMRFSLAEQTYGAIGLLTSGGLNNDQLHTLFLIVLCANVSAIIVAALTVSASRIRYQIMTAAILIGIGALLDCNATNLTRPEQLYLSQALLGFGACLFIGPALLFGFGRVLQLGPNYLISFLILFNVTQNVGGLLGSSLLGTFQIARARAHAGALSENLIAADPIVAARLAQQGASGLYSAMQREATVLAFNDVFQLIAAIAFGTASYMLFLIVRERLRAARAA